MIGLAEAAVDDDGLAVSLHRAFPLLDLHGHMAVDDVASHGVQAELLQDSFAGALVVEKMEIGVRGLLPGALVCHQHPLEGLHFPA